MIVANFFSKQFSDPVVSRSSLGFCVPNCHQPKKSVTDYSYLLHFSTWWPFCDARSHDCGFSPYDKKTGLQTDKKQHKTTNAILHTETNLSRCSWYLGMQIQLVFYRIGLIFGLHGAWLLHLIEQIGFAAKNVGSNLHQ